MHEEREELEGVFMALCDQPSEKQCLEVLRRWKAQILKDAKKEIAIHEKLGLNYEKQIQKYMKILYRRRKKEAKKKE